MYGNVCNTKGCLFSHSSSPHYPINSDVTAATTRAAEDAVFYAVRSAEVTTRATASRDDGRQRPDQGRASDTRDTASRGDGSGRAGGGRFSSMGNVRNRSLPRQEDRCAFSNRGRGSFLRGGMQHDQRQASSQSGDILDQAAIVEDEDF
jgi:hypothetical protein